MVDLLVLSFLEDPRSPSSIEQLPVQYGRSFMWLGIRFLVQCLEVSQKFIPLCIPIHSCVLSPSDSQIWPAHTLFPMLPASLLLSVARLIFYVPEIAFRGRC
jgi:hypothetical protein